jgi:protein SCO1/2
MKNFPKAGLLIVTLVIPALIFAFLRFFATNHYDLSYFNPELDVNRKVIVQKGDTLFRKISGICGEAGQGKIKGLTVVSYLSEVSGDSSKLAVSQLQRIFDMRSDITDLNIVTIDVKGNRSSADLPEEVGKPGWALIKLGKETSDTCFVKELGFNRDPVSRLKPNSLVLIDRQGYIRGYYNGADVKETDRLMAEIKILDYESKNAR